MMSFNVWKDISRGELPGVYKIDVEKSGFKHVTKDGIQVTVQVAVRADVTMEVGAIGQSVEAIALQTETATLSKACSSLRRTRQWAAPALALSRHSRIILVWCSWR